MSTLVLVLAALRATIFLEEDFSGDWESRWVISDWKKKTKQRGTWKVDLGKHYLDAEGNKGLMTTEDNKFYAISTRFDSINMSAVAASGKPFVLQLLVKNEQNWRCAGSYLKLFSSSLVQESLRDTDQYSMMFGPDVCEPDRKTHLIFRYNDENRPMRENLRPDVDPLSHLYTLILRANQTYEVKFDLTTVRVGSLYEDFNFLPPERIKDPAASKPGDWVDDRMLLVGREKPEWWDDIPKRIPEPDAAKPLDWNDDSDGVWQAPMMDNPDYKGAWRPERVPNPDYIGKWEHPMIDNPDFRNDTNIGRYDDIGVLAFELWQVRAGTIFDKILITDDLDYALKQGNESFHALFRHEKSHREKEMRAAIRRMYESQEAEDEEEEEEEEEDDEEDEEDEEEDEEEDQVPGWGAEGQLLRMP